MQIDHEANMPALRRDWLGARIVGGVGLVVLLVAAAMAFTAQWTAAPPPEAATALPDAATPPPPEALASAPDTPSSGAAAPASQVAPPAPEAPPTPAAPGAAPLSVADQHKAENIAICNVALATAQQQGLLPASAKLASDQIASTDVRGRYICLYKTDASRYSIDFDLTCTNLSQGDCIQLYTVSQAGGGVLYQRK